MLPMFRGIRKRSASFKPAIYVGSFDSGQAPSSVAAKVGDMVVCVYRDEADSPKFNAAKISLDFIAGEPGCTVFWGLLTQGQLASNIYGGERFHVFRGPKTLALVLSQAIYASTSVNFGPFTRAEKHAGLLTVMWARSSFIDDANPNLLSAATLTAIGSGSYDYGYTNRSNMSYRLKMHISPQYQGELFNLTKSTATADGIAGAVLEMVA